jgi:hypothetical protein
MGDLLRFKRGLKTNLPELMQGEPGFTTDTESLYVGGVNENIRFMSSKETNIIGYVAPSPNGVDDTVSIKNALTEFLSSDFTTFIFRKGTYNISDNILDAVNAQDKHINGNDAIINDIRENYLSDKPMFNFISSKNVSVKNFKVYGKNKDTSKTLFPFVTFTGCKYFEVSNIYGENILSTLIQLDPRKIEGDCEYFNIYNIHANHIKGFTVFFSSYDYSLLPANIKNGNVQHVISEYNGIIKDGIINENSWSTGIDYGEAVTLVENVNFIDCHSSYAAESGFYSDIVTSVKNINFIGCTAKNNGLKTTAQFGSGWYGVEGITLIGCATENNKKYPIFSSITTAPGINNTDYSVDLYDAAIGKINYSRDHQYRIDNVDGEQMLNPSFYNNYGVYRMDATDTQLNKTINIPSIDNNGDRYTKNHFRTNLFRVEKKNFYYVTLDIMFDTETVLNNNLIGSVVITDENGIFKGSAGNQFSLINNTELPINKRVKLCFFLNITKDESLSQYNYCTFSVINEAKVRIYGISIKRFDKNNVIQDPYLIYDSKDLHMSLYTNYNSGIPFVGEGVSRFKIINFNNENWLVIDKEYTGDEIGAITPEYPIKHYEKLQVKIKALTDTEITDSLGLQIRFGNINQTITPTTTEAEYSFI